jgi:hypothetical protein
MAVVTSRFNFQEMVGYVEGLRFVARCSALDGDAGFRAALFIYILESSLKSPDYV